MVVNGVTSGRGGNSFSTKTNFLLLDEKQSIGEYSSSEPFCSCDNVGNLLISGGRNRPVQIYRRQSDGLLASEKTLSPIGGTDGSYFGEQCIISGDGVRAFVGAWGSKAVHIYRYESNNWVPEQKIINTIASSGRFISVTPDGSRLLIGGSNPNVFIYNRTGTTWTKTITIAPGTGYNSSRFGLSGNTISNDGTIAAVSDDNNGAVAIFSLGATTYTLINVLTQPKGASGMSRTISISQDNSLILVGASGSRTITVYKLVAGVYTELYFYQASSGTGGFGYATTATDDFNVIYITSNTLVTVWAYKRIGDSWDTNLYSKNRSGLGWWVDSSSDGSKLFAATVTGVTEYS